MVAPTTTVTTEAPPTTTVTTDAPTTTVTTVARPTATIDELVGAEGARVHVRCVGEGDTTVVLIAGFGGDTTGWVNVEPAIAARARVCSYDRPGTGTSDPATATATFTTEATDLHDLLSTIGEPGPYVVVGQSVRRRSRRSCSPRCSPTRSAASPSSTPPPPRGRPPSAPSPTTAPSGRRHGARQLHGSFLPTGNSERLDVAAAFAEVAQIRLARLDADGCHHGHRTRTARGLAASEVARLTEAWDQGQQSWVALSTAAHVVTVDHTGHHIELDQPGVVIDEITRLLP